MFIDVQGQGSNVVLLHGLPQHPRDLFRFRDALAEDHRVLLVHLPGYGATPARAPYSLDVVEGELGAQLKVEAPDGYSLVGFSGGSYRALRGTLRGTLEPEKIAALGPLPLVPDPMRQAWLQVAEVIRGGTDVTEAAVTAMFSPAFRAAHPEVVAGYIEEVQGVQSEVIASELEAFARDGSLELAALACPLYLRVGSLDQNTPPALSEAAQSLLQSAERPPKLDVVPDVAHLLHHEDFEGTLAAVRAFLAGD